MNTDPISDEYPLPRRGIRWLGLIFFVFLHAVALIGTPLYVHYRAVTGPELALFAFFLLSTGLSTTIGYHRLFAHGTFEALPVVRFVLLFFGAVVRKNSIVDRGLSTTLEDMA